MFEVWLNSTRLKNLVVTKNLKVTRIVIKMGLTRGGRGGGKREIRNGGITFTHTYFQSFRVEDF